MIYQDSVTLGTYSEPSVAILGNDLLLVAHPVSVPSPEGSGVVNTNGINVLDLKTSALKALDVEAQRGRGVRAREDVSVHEQTPVKILKLPRLS